MLNECANCEVKLEDSLPKKICLRCVVAAQQAFKFKRMCEHSHHFFCDLLNERQKTNAKLELATATGDDQANIGLWRVKVEQEETGDVSCERNIYEDRVEDRLGVSEIDLGPIKIENGMNSETMDSNEAQLEDSNYYTDENGVKDLSSGGDRHYKCPHCAKAFAQNQHLTRHIAGHMGNRPYKCPYSPKDFAQSHHLKRHVCTHTGQPFKCPHCSKAFPLNHLLAEHIRVHTVCHCPKAFTQNPYLAAHIRRHRGERPFQCPYCSKAFGLNHILQTHICGHKGERPHKCAQCSKAFTQKCNLKMHQRRCQVILDSQAITYVNSSEGANYI